MKWTSITLLLAALVVALLAASAFAGVSCPDSCGESLYLGHCTSFDSGDSYCACRSGQAGDDCATAVTGCSFESVSADATDFSPLAVSVYFDDDTLNVAIASPLVTERNYTLVAIDDSAFGDERCTYPGTHWSRSFNSCHDIFTAALPWSDNVACGWTHDQSDESLAVYSAQMIVEHHDVIDPFSNRNQSSPVERVTQHVIPLTVTFPKNVTISSEITVQSAVKLLSAISKQSVAANRQSAVIEITTNLIWPYILKDFTIVSNPGTATSYTASLVSSNCENDGSSCTQVFSIDIVNGDACTLNGEYSLQWTLDCQLDPNSGELPAQCAIQEGDTVTGSLTVLSENFCTQVSTSLPLTGSLASFGDFARTLPKTQFLVGQTLYYRVSMNSPNVTLTGSTIQSVKITSPGEDDILLYSDGVLGLHGTDGAFITTDAVSHADFQFTLSDEFISALADDSSRVYTTTVIVDVDYQDTVTTKRGRRSVEFSSNLNSQVIALSANFEASQQMAAAAASTVAFTGIFAFVAPVAALLF